MMITEDILENNKCRAAGRQKMLHEDRRKSRSVDIIRRRRKRQMQILRRLMWAAAAVLLLVLLLQGNTVLKLRLAVSGCPDSIAEFVERYPEAISFAENYRSYANAGIEADLSGEEENNGIPILIQWDKRWGYGIYGSGYLGLTGCGPTCLTMVICGLTGNTQWNPLRVAEWAEENGYYVPNVGTAWSFMTEGASSFGLTAKTLETDADGILAELAAGRPVICSVTAGDFTRSGHFIVLTGISDDGEIVLNDPNSREKSSRTWTMDRLLWQIAGAWSYQYEDSEY